MDSQSSLREVRDGVLSQKTTAAAATRATLDRIDRLNPELNAFLSVFHDEAMAQAQAVDARVASGSGAGPLAGVPIAIKDNICLDYGKTTCASRMLESYESPYTATCVNRLIKAGAIIIGKTNMDEFAMGSSGEHSHFGPTKNPWDVSRVPGGSSAGSACAVAAGLCCAALGSDTGGSIRQPAALCGVVGMKPTYGRVSRYGLVAFASSLDQVGPFARSVEDAADVLGVICGFDPLDSTCANLESPKFADLSESISGLRIGIPRQARSGANAASVAGAMEDAAAALAGLGVDVVEVDLAQIDHAISAYYIIAPAEASSNLARFDGIRYGHRAALKSGEGLEALYMRTRSEGFGAEVKRRIMLGTHVLSSGYHDAYYNTALKVRRLIKSEYDAIFDSGVHAIMMPTSPGPAFRIGELTDDPLAMYMQDVYTVGVNLAGLPGLSLPAGFDDTGKVSLPVGVQLVCPALGESMLMRMAHHLEQTMGVCGRPVVE